MSNYIKISKLNYCVKTLNIRKILNFYNIYSIIESNKTHVLSHTCIAVHDFMKKK